MTPLHVFADDLTGAAEIAGTAHRFGLRAGVRLCPSPAVPDEITIWDLNTRLMDSATAARVARDFVRASRLDEPEQIFFKVDSAMRGPIRAQLEALLRQIPAERAILAPANPSRGRVICDGQYLINGQPIHRTTFAADPHHPAYSANPLVLLGQGGAVPTTLHRAHEAVPADGIALAETSTPADVEQWAHRVDRQTLAAGAADFFTALLQIRDARPQEANQPFEPAGPTLWICGSTASPSRSSFEDEWRGCTHYLPQNPTAVRECAGPLRRTLAEQNFAILTTSLDIPAEPQVLGGVLAAVTQELVESGAARHLLIEGGATAAQIVRALGFEALETAHEWQPGVVSFSPRGRSDLIFTFKPGSYHWPEAVFPPLPLSLER